jgi:hypothetical protein
LLFGLLGSIISELLQSASRDQWQRQANITPIISGAVEHDNVNAVISISLSIGHPDQLSLSFVGWFSWK